MTEIGERERATQNRIVKLFQDRLGYDYLGDWKGQPRTGPLEKSLLAAWLTRQGHSEGLQTRVFHELDVAAALGGGRNLYQANKDVYGLLRYGVKVKDDGQDLAQTVWLIDWSNPENNDFAIAEEVSVVGENKKRPDVVIYVNGIALGVIELKRSSVSVSEGIRQHLDNQEKAFIRNFFTTMQLCIAGNDTEGLRYGTIETPEKHYYAWKEKAENPFDNPLDFHLSLMSEKTRFLEIIHDFIVFDAGVKKTCRHNQYHGVVAAQEHVREREGGIIWHTQGSGKSLTMVWLAKWIRENVQDGRVLVITDRTELDEQIEGVFLGVDEQVFRTRTGKELISTLNASVEWLVCSLIHKFGRQGEGEDASAIQEFIEELRASLPSDFKAKGEIFVFVDECHRTQSGKLHEAMKTILPQATFIGFTGTPLLQDDKKTSMEVFGPFIHEYKFDEAVGDKVVLDLRYEARDIDQYVKAPDKIDKWFEAKTKGLSETAKAQIKLKWGTLQKMFSSQERLEQIVNDILLDMATKPRLMDGRGNAMLVCGSVYQACKVYELFQSTELAGKCAIVTSYHPSTADIKGEQTGEGKTEAIKKYDVYRKMLADYFEESEDQAMGRAEEFEKAVKKKFVKEPGQMRLLIVVDKLLTGFDAPSATYLYIDKKMADHGLFQAICRVNRLDGEDKEYGYIVDYKDLFHYLEGAITDYTTGAFDKFDKADVKGLLTNRLDKGADRLKEAREAVKAVCEEVLEPRHQKQYFDYFIGDAANKTEVTENEPKRLALYRAAGAYLRAYANLANEMDAAGFSSEETAEIKAEVELFSKLSAEVKLASGDHVDMKLYEPAMRHLLDTYIKAEDTETVEDFEEMGLIKLIVEKGTDDLEEPENTILETEEAMAEAIENNIRRVIIDEQQVNPHYYDKMSDLLEALIEERRAQALEYKEYLEKVKELSLQVVNPGGIEPADYPYEIDTAGKRALYDNCKRDEGWVRSVDLAIRDNKKADWVGSPIKERELTGAIYDAVGDEVPLDDVMGIVRNQHEYK
jgi:type I restriction enzyme R subunit